MATTINAGTATGGAAITADTTGILQLQSGSTPTTAITVDTSQNVGIGTSSPVTGLSVSKSSGFIQLTDGTIDYRSFVWTGNAAAAIGTWSNHALLFNTNNSERMRIDSSGNLYKGGTSGPSGTSGAQVNINYVGSSQMGLFLLDGEASGTSRNAVRFERTSGNTVGSITTTNAGTAYNTTSDYRLKVNPTAMVGALDKVLSLKPVTYQWKIDGSDGEGFIAHELQEVVPSAVTGEKDDVNEDGSINPQAVDYSKLVATLTAAIQELNAKVDAQAAEIASLKGVA